MRVRTPGHRWFDSEWDYSRRCAAPKAGEEPPPASPSMVVDASNALWAQWLEYLEVNLMLALFYPPEP